MLRDVRWEVESQFAGKFDPIIRDQIEDGIINDANNMAALEMFNILDPLRTALFL